MSVSLIDARTNTEVWGHSYNPDRSVSGLFEIQADIARRIADALQVKLDATVRGRIGERPTENAVAYDLFLRATQLPIEWEREANTAAEELLKQALRLDSSFPSALAGLARVYQLRAYTLGAAREWADSGLALARMAVEADTALPAGYAALGFGHLELGHLERSRGAYRKVLESRPSDGEALLVFGWIEFLHGRLDEAVTIWTDALGVDPMNATQCSAIWHSSKCSSATSSVHGDGIRPAVRSHFAAVSEAMDQRGCFSSRTDRTKPWRTPSDGWSNDRVRSSFVIWQRQPPWRHGISSEPGCTSKSSTGQRPMTGISGVQRIGRCTHGYSCSWASKSVVEHF